MIFSHPKPPYYPTITNRFSGAARTALAQISFYSAFFLKFSKTPNRSFLALFLYYDSVLSPHSTHFRTNTPLSSFRLRFGLSRKNKPVVPRKSTIPAPYHYKYVLFRSLDRHFCIQKRPKALFMPWVFVFPSCFFQTRVAVSGGRSTAAYPSTSCSAPP